MNAKILMGQVYSLSLSDGHIQCDQIGEISPFGYFLPGMSDPNKRYDRWNGNSRTVKITFFHTGQIILPSLEKFSV
jgi:hypothetical protein